MSESGDEGEKRRTYEKVMRRHRSAREEGLRHPPISFFKVIWRCSVTEDVHEKVGLALVRPRSQPSGYFAQKHFVVLHVLEHLG